MLSTSVVGLSCKAFVRLGLCSLVVDGLPTLLNALEHHRRWDERCGVITVSNHISVLDDPLAWAVLPARYYISSHMTRWTLGASDIMFTNPLFSAFFRSGQVLETFRGHGVYQRSVDRAIELLDRGAWIHLFPEGKVNQSPSANQLLRFKWGIGRILMETARPPIVIPMFLSGFDALMPEARHAPYKYLPRLFQSLRVVFGDPLSEDDVRRGLIECASKAVGGDHLQPQASVAMAPWLLDAIKHEVDLDSMRSEVTALMQRHVESLASKTVHHRQHRL